MVRDFIYFDKNKVISYGSQLLGGFTESKAETLENTKAKNKQISMSGDLDGEFSIGKDSSSLLTSILSRIGALEIKASGGIEGGFEIQNSQGKIVTEQKVLDHYQFNLLRNALLEHRSLKDLDEIKPHEWSNRTFLKKVKPGDFVEFTCRTKLFDVKHLESIARTFEQLMNLMQQVAISEMLQKKESDGENVGQIIENMSKGDSALSYAILKQALGSNIEPVLFNAIIELMKGVTNGGLTTVPTQMMIRPTNAPKSGIKFIAPIREENLTEPKNEMIFKYGYEPEQDWRVLAQICKIPKEESNKSASMEQLNNISSGAIDEVINQITEFFTDMSTQIGMHSFIKYPDISINLIALYR